MTRGARPHTARQISSPPAGTGAFTANELLALPAVVPIWPTAGRALGLSRPGTYDLARRGEFPCPVLKVGSRYRVTRSALLAALGIEDRGSAA